MTAKLIVEWQRWVNLDTFGRGDAAIHVRYASNTDRKFDASVSVALCQSRPNAAQQKAPLVDHLVGEDQDRIWDREPDRFRGSEIEDHVELCGLFHG
jgi:hypothetical protein